jgi:outer membrane protein
MKTKYFGLAVLAFAALFAGSAQAQSAGTFTVRAGATTIMPNVTSGDLSAPSLPNTRVDIKKASQFTGGITYMWTDNIAVDLPLGLAFKHEVVGAGAIDGVGTLATVKALPITLTLQYRLGGAQDKVRPYAGIGGTYAKFFDSRGTVALNATTGGTPANPTVMNMDNKFGSLVQLGVVARVYGQWSVDLCVNKTFISTDGHLSTGQNIHTKLDPTAVVVGVGYTF